MNPGLFAIAAIVPLALGATPTDHEEALIVSLCNGGTIAIPLGENDSGQEQPCHAKACHAGACRKQIQKLNGLAKG
jgi:hypothetical protein